MIITLNARTLKAILTEASKMRRKSQRGYNGRIFLSSECIGIANRYCFLWFTELKRELNSYQDQHFYYIDVNFLKEFLATAEGDCIIDTVAKTVNGRDIRVSESTESFNEILNSAKENPIIQRTNWEFFAIGYNVLKHEVDIADPKCAGSTSTTDVLYSQECNNVQFNMLIARVYHPE